MGGRPKAIERPRLVHRRGNLIKIGFTKSIKERLKALQAISPVRLKVICFVKGGKLREAAFHQTFAPLRAHGEWFRAPS